MVGMKGRAATTVPLPAASRRLRCSAMTGSQATSGGVLRKNNNSVRLSLAASRAWWGSLWADRVRYSRFAEQAVEYGLSNQDELEAIAHAWMRWASHDDSVFVIPHGEILARG